MDTLWNESLWRQFAAAIDMLENAVTACPDEVWGDRAARPEYWYTVYHTLFWLDLYLSGSLEGFAPPEPFTLDELDEAGILPDRVYSKDEMLGYLAHGREKCRRVLGALTAERAAETCRFGPREIGFLELLLDNMRHVQHHTAQLNLILRQRIDSAPRWITRAETPLGAA